MASNIGAKIELQGEAQFRKAVTQINTNLKTLGTEMTMVKSQFDKGDKSIESYTKKNIVLNKQIGEQKNKISELEKGLSAANEKYGANASQTQKWQQDLNRATAQLNKMEREVKNNNKAIEDANDPTKELSKEIDNMGKNADGAGGKLEKLGGALKTSAVAMGAVAVAAGAAAIKLGKEVISSFGSYEQLVGGVDTLFKDSSQLLQDYAANAHKTAGLSANDYMETVTSFSASLIQSLGGDTEKAVEYADMAITDMSDNANKMGTDISSIQNAYQGFAKGTFTMLDNLKIGYAGTKSEMERLLADATAISGISYDVSSYSDVVSAIHIIQENMGIAGATALEAEETIEGSLNAFKASFENLITGFGNADADVGKLTENLITSFDTVLENIMPVINNIIGAFPQIFAAIIPAIGELLPELLSTATGLFSQVLDTLIKLLPTLIPVAVNAIMTITNTLLNNIPLLIDSAIMLIMSLSDGLIDALPILIPAAITIIIALAGGLIDALPELIRRLPEIITAIVNGLIEGIPKILEFIPKLYKSLAGIVTETDWAQMGKDIVEGLWNGINSLADWIREKVTGFVKGIGDTIKNFFGIESPSTLMAEYGKYIDEGLAQGIKDNAGKPISATDNLVNAIGSAMQKVNTFVTNTVGIVKKEFELWKLQNEDLIGSSQELEMQLEAQKQEHELLTEQIRIAESALVDIISKYGEGSAEALNYKNKLLDIQIEQKKLTGSIEETTKALDGMVDAQLRVKIENYDKLSDSEKRSQRSSYNKQRDNYYDAYKDEIRDIAKRQGVTNDVAQDMHRKNLELGIPKYASGTNNHPGGLAWVGELGRELINIPRGTQVYNNQESQNIARPVNLSLNIGTLIADDYGLKKLERKLKDIRIDEDFRLGVVSG